jgi:hypothetical protein
MKTLILASLLALTAVSGVVAASQSAAAFQLPKGPAGGCGMTALCKMLPPPAPVASPRPIHFGPPGGYTPLNRQ